MTYIIGIDPGKSMGIVVMDFPEIINVFQGDPIEGVIFLHHTLHNLRRLAEINREDFSVAVAIERFIITPGTGRRPGAGPTSALVGRLEGIVAEYPGATAYMQNVSDASRFSNALLRKMHLLVKAKDVGCIDANDANSAVRHVLLFLARNRADLFEKLVGDLDWTT